MSELLTIKPIGIIRTEMRDRFQTPHQATDRHSKGGVIELLENNDFETALQDLVGFDRIWLVWWFHKNFNWKPKVRPPRGNSIRRGLFATRSPHRPNPLGMSAVTLEKIEHLKIHVGPCDLLDGTPILDIKPYIPSCDSFPDSSIGWLAQVESELIQSPKFVVQMSKLADTQAQWLKTNWNIDFIERASAILKQDPRPHRTRRITKTKDGDNSYRMGCGAWRIFFEISEQNILINRIAPGYSPTYLARYDNINDQQAQLTFLTTFPQR